MNYEEMSKNAICVEVDKYLSADEDGSRPAFDYDNPDFWGWLMSHYAININHYADGVEACHHNNNIRYSHCCENIGRAISICYLKMMKAK